jgi:hypothetical protein
LLLLEVEVVVAAQPTQRAVVVEVQEVIALLLDNL